MANHRHLLRRLGALPGPGTSREYLDLLGPSLTSILDSAGRQAGVLVERQMATSSFRPTPAELGATWRAMQQEQSQQREESINQQSRGCGFCGGVGQVTAYLRSRRKGSERVRTYSVTCSCPRGARLHGSQLQYGKRLSIPEFEVKCKRDEARSEWHDGVLDYWVQDLTKGAPPEWARYSPALVSPNKPGDIR